MHPGQRQSRQVPRQLRSRLQPRLTGQSSGHTTAGHVCSLRHHWRPPSCAAYLNVSLLFVWPPIVNAHQLRGAVCVSVVRPKGCCRLVSVVLHGSARMCHVGALSVRGTNEVQRSGTVRVARLRQRTPMHASVNSRLSAQVSATRASSVASSSKAIASGATPAAVASSTPANPSVEGTHNGGARLLASATLAAPSCAPHVKR